MNAKTLFSYRRLSEYEISNLENDQVWFGSVGNFNDPEEGLVHSQVIHNGFDYFDSADVIRAGQELYQNIKSNWMIPDWFSNEIMSTLKIGSEWDVYVELGKLIEKLKLYRNKLRVYCLTPIGSSSLMWAHYADSHKGICIEYSVNYERLPAELSSVPINYSSVSKIFSSAEMILHPGSIIERMCFTKSLDWAYENEWRVVSTTFADTFKLCDDFKIVSITTGYRNESKRLIMDICRRKGYEYYEIKETSGNGLTKTRISPVNGKPMIKTGR